MSFIQRSHCSLCLSPVPRCPLFRGPTVTNITRVGQESGNRSSTLTYITIAVSVTKWKNIKPSCHKEHFTFKISGIWKVMLYICCCSAEDGQVIWRELILSVLYSSTSHYINVSKERSQYGVLLYTCIQSLWKEMRFPNRIVVSAK